MEAVLLYSSIVTFVLFMIFDVIWWGVLAKGFFKSTMGHMARMSGGDVNIFYPSGAFVYILMSVGLSLFVIKNPSVDSMQTAALYGGFLGACLFITFDFTNHAILANYPIKFAVVDTLWGTFMCTMVSIITFKIVN